MRSKKLPAVKLAKAAENDLASLKRDDKEAWASALDRIADLYFDPLPTDAALLTGSPNTLPRSAFTFPTGGSTGFPTLGKFSFSGRVTVATHTKTFRLSFVRRIHDKRGRLWASRKSPVWLACRPKRARIGSRCTALLVRTRTSPVIRHSTLRPD